MPVMMLPPIRIQTNKDGLCQNHTLACGVTRKLATAKTRTPACRGSSRSSAGWSTTRLRGRNIGDDYDDTFLPVNWQQLQQQPTNAR
mmetsp:Transcript_11174/g.23592  ORF Transcript_11174/g.23592 Transcript_11174/m.23592 type:complete len:87 (+) Transcript_11174:224-484(+)